MRKESAGVTEALLKSAEQEFLAHGFHDGSLRRISAESGVSTNSIYTRFGDKAGLFETLVKPAADGLMQIYMDSVQAASDVSEVTDAIACGNRGTDDVLVYITRISTHSGSFSAVLPGRNTRPISTGWQGSKKAITRSLPCSFRQGKRWMTSSSM